MGLAPSTRSEHDVDVESAFEALSHQVRREIAAHLAESGELSAGDIADRVPQVGRTTVSSHLRILRTAGIVIERQDGRYRYYRLDQDGIVREVLSFMQQILRQPVTDLAETATALDRTERRTG
ncbi:metalloregulator ArsR/SmtB family transcription factor [Microbacterium sp. NPDC077184]|uniref:ArsR/SmtB family transcription factor n=1 Tax=Microbacterium sp. NPDC077184 TaxID=3154764 RepID=UPI00341D4FE6